jgi:hypothetical protein
MKLNIKIEASMQKYPAMEGFAPAILSVYNKNKEKFWAAVMAPFLSSQFSVAGWMCHLSVDIRLISAFKGLEKDARKLQQEFGKPLGLDISGWESNRLQYFKDAYPVFAFLAVWMDEQGLDDLLNDFGLILQAGVFAVAGYGILDENVDSDNPSPVQVITAQALIAEYEIKALHLFGVTRVNLDVLHKMRSLFLEAEIREKAMRWKGSPYSLDHPEQLGAKGANAVSPFMLCLDRLGRAERIDDYWQVFLFFGAAIQMIDDWKDLEKDLAAGHYSFVTLGREELLGGNDPATAAQILRKDQGLVNTTYEVSIEMINRAKEILKEVDDRILLKLVEVTEARVERFFHKEMTIK